MRTITWFITAALAASASIASAQAPGGSAQHQARGHSDAAQHQSTQKGEKCCCEEMMREMHKKMQMMQQQGMGMGKPKQPPQPDKEHAH